MSVQRIVTPPMVPVADPLAGLHPIFRDCVDPDAGEDARYRLDTPFRVGDRVYATDGRIAVRMPLPGPWADAVDGRRPKVEEVVGWAPGLHEPAPTPLPDLLPPERMRCYECRGTGKVTCQYDHEHECPGCDGEGTTPNFEEEVVLRESPRVRTSAAFAHLLKRHGATLYLPLPGSEAKAIRFTVGDDIEGLLQPLREDD